MNNICSVILSSSTRKFDKEYHYIIPEDLIGKVELGIRVIVPFGRSNKHVEGYVTGLFYKEQTDGLKAITEVIDQKPVLSPKIIELVRWMKIRYICTYSDAIRCMIPPGIGVVGSKTIKLIKRGNELKGNAQKIINKLEESGGELLLEDLKSEVNIKSILSYLTKLECEGFISILETFSSRVSGKSIKVAYLARPVDEVIEDIENNRFKNIKQVRILEMLIENDFIGVSDIVRFAGVSSSVLKTLNKYGYIEYKDIEITRDPMKNRHIPKTLPLKPTVEQDIVINRIKEMLNRAVFEQVLLHGITGSGKTEVYLQLIRQCLDMGKQAIVLVPEISLTPQMVERFKGRFGDDVAVLHSRLSLGERYDQWRLIKDEKVKVVVGARSAIFAPFKDLGLVVIDEEHETSYKSELTPKYHVVDVAVERCKIEGAVLVCGSATPSIETYYGAKCGRITLLEMNKRTNNMSLPKVHVVDMRIELDEGNRSVFSRVLHEEIKINIDLEEQTIIFLNRRGYASFVLCRSCGYTIKCPHCDVSLTYHAHDLRLICHYCGFTIKNPGVCPKCKSNHIRSFGSGTQKIEDEIIKQFANSTVVRMDMDTTTHKNSHENILKNFRENNINIMVGTQMIAKGHDFPKVTLVGVLAADSLLNSGDYRATERTFQLITQVAGRAGRSKLPGRVFIQTYNTENFSIVSACNQDFASFYKQEIILREKLMYPPFINLACIIISGVNDKLTHDAAVGVKKSIDKYIVALENIIVLGPARAPLPKIKSKYRWRIVIKCKELDILIDTLTHISDTFYSESGKYSVNLSVDINPVNML